MSTREIVLCQPVRTAIGAFNGTFKSVSATELGAAAVRATLARAGLDAAQLGSVVLGNVVQAGNRMNPARQAAVHGGVPVSVPALTVNRVCGSGAQAIASAAQEVLLGLTDVALAGGMENMDRAPYLLDGGRWGYRMGNAEIHDSMLRDGLVDAFSNEHSGWHTEDLVAETKLTRDAQDRWAARSQQRFAAAQAAGRFKEEIVAVDVKGKKGVESFATDEAPRPDTTFETLAKLRPAFRPDGTITAGNAPGLNSAASAMLVAERGFAEAKGLTPMVKLVAYGVGAVEPGMFGLGPVPAVQLALRRAGWSLGDVERFEINEAFAAVPLAVMQKLGIPEDIVNVEGGAIAHGHPIGATGAILTTRLAHSMQRDGIRRGIVTLCIGGGQGIALALEKV
ncbi:thiolase family protein [Paraburkholderia caballeronis]|uniref:Acetyl-CoA C-acetyltransferase n=1 Tax=Paraburkholderia caballeronis TaxID=416943 RepID=A0A1H7V9G9_9BURK|nr:thiolase family protein [Paraburkholderia caballeronis]PXW16479.1 acetyl-CoA C-acetyltransferase [Paraburkholderia caballeronis]PXW94244.1 acetyl-CoA C-acetyltransferase [Paraburkholderia caballeronis]RAJ89729.1 acetyl-CoA C-acetyltransferase [Paraburkholderia caballeronis]SED93528.1 acetyl-CoA C-acetyltransferase [Paraburkholderia caballeronis]SEM05639.1 acetyl-CoA C-acetyltransferase [Paraburkholderia caballeronis]